MLVSYLQNRVPVDIIFPQVIFAELNEERCHLSAGFLCGSIWRALSEIPYHLPPAKGCKYLHSTCLYAAGKKRWWRHGPGNQLSISGKPRPCMITIFCQGLERRVGNKCERSNINSWCWKWAQKYHQNYDLCPQWSFVGRKGFCSGEEQMENYPHARLMFSASPAQIEVSFVLTFNASEHASSGWVVFHTCE